LRKRHVRSKFSILSVVACLSLSGAVVSISCSRDKRAPQEAGEHGMPTGWKFTLPKGDPAQGRKIFVELECYKCHEVKGETLPAMAEKEKGAGPELSQMARIHPVEYFAESIINPNAVIYPGDKEKGYLGDDGKSKMPNYNDILTIEQVADLAAYITSLKGDKHVGH